jgi:predicted N-formylglutamate amidohydrolase
MQFDSIAISCEHASNRIPVRYQPVFRRARGALESHRGWDIGAAAVARAIARRYRTPLFAGHASRLLIDLNRSLHHPAVFSQWSRPLPSGERRRIVERHYLPYRRAVEEYLRRRIDGGEAVLLVSVHSFTPVWNGARRVVDIGLLYDPRRRMERLLCAAWKDALAGVAPQLRVRRNHPYRGTSDGFSVALRQSLRSTRFACVELEVNQELLGRVGNRAIASAVTASLDRVAGLG